MIITLLELIRNNELLQSQT